jgi:tripartite-type tricarboxylate transporter receptor subunit TctC
VRLEGAQAYPDKFVRVIMSVPPGGSADLVTRTISERLSENLGKPFIVESRATSGGEAGITAVARSSPDGYNLLSTPNGPISVALHLKHLSYDVTKDLTPVAMEAFVAAGIAVNAKLPIYSVSDLIRAARDSPDGLSYSHSGVGNVMHLSGELLKHMTGAKLVPIPYQGTYPAVMAIARGDVPFGIADMTSLMPLAESGGLRILAVINSARVASAPGIPTVAESGFVGYAVDPWIGLFAPAGTPTEIVDCINSGVGLALAQREVRQILVKSGLQPVAMTPEDMRHLVLDEIEKWGTLVKAIGLDLR